LSIIDKLIPTNANYLQNVVAEVREKFPGIPATDLIATLQAAHAADARVVPVKVRVAGAYPPEGAVALARALKRTFGYVDYSNATMMAVETDVGVTEQVPWGSIIIPGLSGILRTELVWERGNPVFSLGGEVRSREMPRIQALEQLLQEELARGSIYKGKAVRFDLPKIDDEEQRKTMSVEDFCPKFIPLDHSLDESVLVLPALTWASVNELVFAPVKYTERFRQHRIPLRNGIIMYGPPGCGKTLIAAILANLCVEHGWTFVEVRKVEQLDAAYRFAAERAPAVLQLEDIDRLMDTDSDTIVQIRNTLDGVDTKRAEVQVVFTSNCAERLPENLVRSGRLGHHIKIGPPDEYAAAQLLRNYSGPYLNQEEDLHAVGKVMTGRVPAMLRDVVERAKRRRIISHGDLDSIDASELELTGKLVTGEFDELQPETPDTREPIERGLDNLAEAVSDVIDVLAPRPEDDDEGVTPTAA
jgi:hypothetical protein